MSKYVKDLVSNDISRRLEGVEDAVLVNVIGMDSESSYLMRKDLREKNIHLLVVKNSLARRACEGTGLMPAFDGLDGCTAIAWGGEDFVSLVKEIVDLDKKKPHPAFEARGGVLDGEQLSAEKLKEISKWPSRVEMLSILSGQLLSPGANLSGALLGPGKALASQIKKKSEEEDGED
jgi:large subunit ribosomal protein L10